MAPEIAIAGLANFLAAHHSLLAELYAQAEVQTQAKTPTQAASQDRHWDVSPDEFAATLHRSATHHFGATLPFAPALEAYLRGLHLADLALACALLQGSEAAWTEFVATYRPTLYAAARAIVGAADEARARELADSLYAELYGVDRSARKPLLQYFHGRSKLTTWLRAVLAQKFVDSLRATQRFQTLDDEREQNIESRSPLHSPGSSRSSNIADPGAGDPDRQRLIPHLRQAFTESLAALAPADRLLLSLYYVQELTLAQIARLRGVHEATVSRQLDRLRRELRANIENSLSAARPHESNRTGRTALSLAEIQLCFTYAQEDWALDLSSVLMPSASASGVPSGAGLTPAPNAEPSIGDT